MQLEIDTDIRAIAEFMQRNVPATRLVGVAAGVNALAPLLWGQHKPDFVQPIRLSRGDLHIQPSTSGCSLEPESVGDGSAAAMDGPG